MQKAVMASIFVPAEYRMVVREHIWTWQKLQGAKRASFSEADGDSSGRVRFSGVPEAILPVLRLKAIPFEAISGGEQRQAP